MSKLTQPKEFLTELNSEDAASINGGALWEKVDLGNGSFRITKFFKNKNNVRWVAIVDANCNVSFDPYARQPKKLNRATCQAKTIAVEAPLGCSQRSHFC